uniref:RING-type domain-containing protein n=1 Tax=Palpitomonas bilix TaxID=652834 RepID=A0A7S3D803_9EUKA|mmetsp:Transcript_26202/g.66634  ORF Transcript_26202/g.66634 Transcript_26202/m.66634 type:complete len:761 (+) Transcript_26202:582-2864(+)
MSCTYSQAVAHHNREEFDKSVPILSRLCQQDENKEQASALRLLGICYLNGLGVQKNEVKAVECFVKSIQLGNTATCSSLAECYRFGTGVAKCEEKALELYRRVIRDPSTKGSNARACSFVNLGCCYQYGQGVRKDLTEAVKFFEKASGCGEPAGFVQLGICYYLGEGVAENKEEALRLFQEGERENMPYAYHNIGFYHEFGKGGFNVNEELAIKYYKQAADLGSRVSVTTLKERLGINYVPERRRYSGFHDEEENLAILQPNLSDSLSKLLADCSSQVELEILLQCFPFYRPSSSARIADSSLDKRPLASLLLHLARSAHNVSRQGSVGVHPDEKEGTACVDTSFSHMMTIVAGLKSGDIRTQEEVGFCIRALKEELLHLEVICEHNQAILRSFQESGEAIHTANGSSNRTQSLLTYAAASNDIEERKQARKRAMVLSTILNNSPSSFPPHLLADMRRKVETQLNNLRSLLTEFEAQHPPKGAHEAKNYLLAAQTEGMMRAKIILHHVLKISNQVKVDLLCLNDKDLKGVLNRSEVEGASSIADSILKHLEEHCNKIRNKENGADPTRRLSSTADLSLFLSGSLPEGMIGDAAMVDATAHLANIPDEEGFCACSTWYFKVTECWTSLKDTLSEWKALEERIKEALSSDSATLTALNSLLTELDKSTLLNRSLRAELESKMRALPHHAMGNHCLTCKVKSVAVRFFPCRHYCSCLECALAMLLAQEEKEELQKNGTVSLKDSRTVAICLACKERVTSIAEI